MKLDFITKKRTYHRYKQDVNIRPINNTKKGISIVFKNKAKERITKTEYLSIAITDKRLYFAEMNRNEGYKATLNGAYAYRTNILGEDLYEWAKENAGSYSLEYDEDLKYFFIQVIE